jgi:hypothetical protein
MVDGSSTTDAGQFVVPTTTGSGYEITSPLQPLAEMRSEFSIVSGMRIPYSTTSSDASAVPAGGAYRDFHGGGCSPLLSGTRSTEANFRCNGITSDQVMANLYRDETTHASLVMRAQPAFYVSGFGFAGRQYMSYSGPRERVEALTSPQVLFRSIFGDFRPDDARMAAEFDFHQRSRRSVLDLISGKRSRLLATVGAGDRVRLERHFDEIRALEMRLAGTPPVATGSCAVPMDPGVDPAIGGDNPGAGSAEIVPGLGYSNEQERIRDMCDLTHMAFVCDLSRVATLQMTTFQSHMNVLPITTELGLPVHADLHEVGHNGDANRRGQIPVSLCLQWHVSHYAYLLDKLRSSPEGESNVLDNSAIILMTEAGHGRQLNDASSENQTHSVENMMLLVGGRAGGLQPGRHIDSGGAHPVQGLISAMRATGFEGDSLGEVSGHIPELFSS